MTAHRTPRGPTPSPAPEPLTEDRVREIWREEWQACQAERLAELRERFEGTGAAE
jgi:hypothetical protein